MIRRGADHSAAGRPNTPSAAINRVSAFGLLTLGVIAGLAGVLAVVPAWAQDRAPLTLTAPSPSRAAPAPDQPGAPRSVDPNRSGAGAYEVGPIAAPRGRGPSIISDDDVTLGRAPWYGTEAALAQSLIKALPVGAPSPTMGGLVRAILIAHGPNDTPQDRPWLPGFLDGSRPDQTRQMDTAFLSERLLLLHEAGHIEDAEALAADLTGVGSADEVRAWIQAVAALLDHEEDEACGLAEIMRTRSKEVFWVKLRIFCYVRNGFTRPARTISDVLRERGGQDPLFYALLAALLDETPVPEDVWQYPVSALPYAMARHGGVPLPAEAIARAEPSVLRAVAINIQPRDPRQPDAPLDRGSLRQALAAAERSVMTGALEAQALAHAYAEIPFADESLKDPIGAAATLSPEEVNALFFQAIDGETIAARQIVLLHTALTKAWQSGSGLPVTLVYADVLSSIEPDQDLAWAGGQLGLAALVVGETSRAYLWRNTLERSLVSAGPRSIQAEQLKLLDMALALGAPRDDGNRSNSGFLGLSSGSEVLPGARMNVTSWVEAVTDQHPQRQIDNLEATLTLLSALGHPLTTEAWSWLTARNHHGVADLPSPALVRRAKDAAGRDRVAEALSLALILAGSEGPTAPSVSRMVSSLDVLQALDFDTMARRLALETFLARHGEILAVLSDQISDGGSPPAPTTDVPGLAKGLAAQP